MLPLLFKIHSFPSGWTSQLQLLLCNHEHPARNSNYGRFDNTNQDAIKASALSPVYQQKLKELPQQLSNSPFYFGVTQSVAMLVFKF
jgi:hypothetical protein